MFNWLKKYLWTHHWIYRNHADRTCSVCHKHEVMYCSDVYESCWWEANDDGDVTLHYENKAVIERMKGGGE